MRTARRKSAGCVRTSRSVGELVLHERMRGNDDVRQRAALSRTGFSSGVQARSSRLPTARFPAECPREQGRSPDPIRGYVTPAEAAANGMIRDRSSRPFSRRNQRLTCGPGDCRCAARLVGSRTASYTGLRARGGGNGFPGSISSFQGWRKPWRFNSRCSPAGLEGIPR